MGVDLHLHSTASDGTVAPELVPSLARSAGLHTIALTDHDTVDGVPAAIQSGRAVGVRVIAGCEFSVAVSWGEMHLLGYFLPLDDPDLEAFLSKQRAGRERRIGEILSRLTNLGVDIPMDAVAFHADKGSMGRPHVARALVDAGVVRSVDEAFHRYLADGKKAFVPKELASAASVAALVRRLGGVTSAAHLKDRGTRTNIEHLRDLGVDAIEVRHPSHDHNVSAQLHHEASNLDMLMTGGSDWHGATEQNRDSIGAIDVPDAWLEKVEQMHRDRLM